MQKNNKQAVRLLVDHLQGNGYHLFVNVKVNGLPCRFLVDTGASKTVIDKNYVEKKFGKRLIKTIKQQTTGLHSSTQESYTARLKSIAVGKVENKNYVVTAVDLNHVNSIYTTLKSKRIQGILGSDLMMKEKMIIDYNTLKLSFA